MVTHHQTQQLIYIHFIPVGKLTVVVDRVRLLYNFTSSLQPIKMSGNTKDLDAKAAAGETVVEGGTGGKSLQAQQNLAEGQHLSPFIMWLYSVILMSGNVGECIASSCKLVCA